MASTETPGEHRSRPVTVTQRNEGVLLFLPEVARRSAFDACLWMNSPGGLFRNIY
jgi:hypothetical protein